MNLFQKAYELAVKKQQTLGRNQDYYITIEQLNQLNDKGKDKREKALT